MANTRLGNANVFATLPFDQIDGVAGTFLHDDFITAVSVLDYADATTGAAQISDLAWQGNEIGANSAAGGGLVIPGEVDHPGILQLESGETTPGDGDGVALQLGAAIGSVQDTLVYDDNGVYIASVTRILDVDGAQTEFGFTGQQPVEPNSSALDIVSWVWDPADAANVGDEFFIIQCNGAGTDVEVVSTLPYVEGDWVLLELGVTDTSVMGRVTTEDGTETIEVPSPTVPIVAQRPFFGLTNVGAAEELYDLDAFHMRYLRRDAIVGTGSDWLGA